MEERKNWFKLITGKTEKEAFRVPTSEEILNRLWKLLHTKYDLFSLGVGTAGEMWFTEEERENHVEIIGSTGEGKSKLLELKIRHDIDKGNGLLFLDGSSRAETAYDILRYCAKKGHKKVILIDPQNRWKYHKVIGVNPFHYKPSLREPCIANVTDIVRTIFGSKDGADTPLINKVVPAILQVLFEKELTLYETIYFSEYNYVGHRHIIFEDQDNRFANYLKRLCYEEKKFNDHIGSTTRRFEPMYNEILHLMIGFSGISFTKIIRDGWVVLVNLNAKHFEPLHNKFLGTLLINEMIFAAERLKDNDWNGVFYLYIDEAGEYSNRKLAQLLAYHRKSGIRVTLAHQYNAQFEDKYIFNAVTNLTKTKIAFYIPDPEDRLKWVKTAFGGDLPDREVSYNLGRQPKQNAVVKKGKESAQLIRIPDIERVQITKQELDLYIKEIHKQPWYKTPEEAKNVIRTRFFEIENPPSASRTAESIYKAVTKNNGDKTGNGAKVPDKSGEGKSNRGKEIPGVAELFMEAKKRQTPTDGQTPPRTDGDQPVRKPEDD